MKTFIKLILSIAFILLIMGCPKDDDTEPISGQDVTETFYSNPMDNQILSIDSAGRQLILMGPKDSDGMPRAITQALVDAEDMNPEHQMLMDFNADGTISRISNPNLGTMTFTYVNETTWVIKMTLPDTLGSYQITFDPTQVKATGDCGCGITHPPAAGPMRSNLISYLPGFEPRHLPSFPFQLKQSGSTLVDASITATYQNTGKPVKGVMLSGIYTTDDGKTGGVQCQPGNSDGVWGYSMPNNPAPPPPSGFKAKAYALFNALCYGAIPINYGKTQICSMFAPTGVGAVACYTIVTAYVWMCRINTAKKAGSYVYDIYSAEEIAITLTAQHPLLDAQIKFVDFKPASPSLPNVSFVFPANAKFESVYTNPVSPVASSGYIIVATLSDIGTEAVPVRLSMVGSDGYTQSSNFSVEPGGSCQMSIPGAAQGVRDDITARINPGFPSKPGQVIHHYIVFQ